MLSINFLNYQRVIKVVTKDNKQYFYDPIRKKNILVQPEELVRQLVLTYFISENIYPTSRIAVEKSILIDNRRKRFDILVFDKSGKPFILVECKSFDVKITDEVIKQIAIYNQKLKTPYLFITNGKTSFLAKIDFEVRSFEMVSEWPK